MNGGYGGGPAFDFGDNYGFCSNNNDQQDQQSQPQQNRYLQNTSHFDSFDPSMGNSLLGLQYNNPYRSTASHSTFLTPSVTGVTADTLFQLQQQQQQQQHNFTNQANTSNTYAFNPTFEPIQSMDKDPIKSLSKMAARAFSPNIFPDHNNSAAKTAEPARKANPDLWLETLKIKCSDVSLEPLTGSEVLKRVRSKTDDVVTRYLPCVEFLVMCQQELRAGLAAATQKRLIRHSYRDSMTPHQFYQEYLDPLPDRFFQRNKTIMETKVIETSVSEIEKLCSDSKRVEYQGCEVMKNTFLGGMKDGESWGLRKWLSKHGGALHICNDLECILRSCQDLERSLETTQKLAERLRPLAQQALERLRNDVPTSYQEHSTAHPYLPFFHRLESALKGMANFDPEDDDVICIDDDDEIEEVKQLAKEKEQAKRKSDIDHARAKKRKICHNAISESKLVARKCCDESDDDSIIEIVDVKPAPNGDTLKNFDGMLQELEKPSSRKCFMYLTSIDGQQTDSEEENNEFKNFANEIDTLTEKWEPSDSESTKPANSNNVIGKMTVEEMAAEVEKIAFAAERHEHLSLRPQDVSVAESFWDLGPQFASALRLLTSNLRNQEASSFLDIIDDDAGLLSGKPAYSSIIKHPICSRDIALALIGDGNGFGNGRLPLESLCSWNMWRGNDLLQAMDLVFLNSLAYNGKEKTKERSTTNKLRRSLWEGIHSIITEHAGTDAEKRRRYTPTRRGETSGFVIRK